ncbi:hypothetical protein EDB81DRAFT_684244 [Dactylonectria macrodidyma]|uniref:Zn(2)-C6 fungal-type domain-containing protein n=1 Tax=Dactylonectria macrodidyma TaxID=307937 RepID=A0A9P9F8C5_9HYPO|nr:hypothetical protein EDB81DRAFT_684244 [Dactylonectria macrodidyma]
MYGPAPPRRKKTGITRSRAGCMSCRLRHKKCDEKKPVCTSCVRLGQPCQQTPSKLAFRTVTFASGTSLSSTEPSMQAPAIWSQGRDPNSATPTARTPKSYNYLSMKKIRDSGQTRFYYDMWEKHCLPALHPALRRLGKQDALPSVLRDAVLALSACQMSRMMPRKKPFDPRGIPGLSFRPDPDHQTVSQEIYGSALSSLASWTNIDHSKGFNVILTAMILLAHVELLMGDFGQFGSHSMGVDRLLTSFTKSTIRPNRPGCELIANWTQARAHNWWLRFHFGTSKFHRDSEPLACPPWLMSVLEEADDSRAVIMTTLCECCRLNSAIFLRQWDMDDVASRHDPVEQISSFHEPGLAISRVEEASLSASSALADQREILDRWHNRLPLSELPIEAFMEAPSSASLVDGTSVDVQPLRFTSHYAAMNYAYYVMSRLLLCAAHAQDFEPHPLDSQEATRQGANYWAFLLMRIAANLDWGECTKLNTFIIGLSGLFLSCAIHSSDNKISLWMQDWLEQRYTTTVLEEGSFPVLQVLQVLRAVLRERREGRVVKAVFTSIEDEGGTGKYGSYNSQHIDSLLVYGYDNATGQKFSHHIAL